MSNWGTAIWGQSVWGAAFPGCLWVTTGLAASCEILATIPNSLEVLIVPASVLQSNVFRISLKFRNSVGRLADPTLVTLRLLKPDESELSPAPTPTRLSTGVWTYDLDTTGLAPGVWTYRGEGHGLVDAAAEGTFEVVASAFT